MAEWRIVYAGLREKYPLWDKSAVRDAAERFVNESDAAEFLLGQLELQARHIPRQLPQSEAGGGLPNAAFPEHSLENPPSQAGTPQDPESAPDGVEGEEEEGTPSVVGSTLENWDSYLQAAVTAADSSADLEVQAAAATLPSSETVVSKDESSELSYNEGQGNQAVSLTKEKQRNASQSQVEDLTLEDLVCLSVEDKETLAADLAAYAKLRETAAEKESEVEAAKERTRVAGEAERKKWAEVQQAVDELERVNERRSGEVNGELAMLATEAKELRRNLALLKEERSAIRAMLEQLQGSLQRRIASAEAVIATEESEAYQLTALAQADVDKVAAKLHEAEAEKMELDRKEAEAEKLHGFIMQQGKLVDSMLAEVTMLKEDLASAERLATTGGSQRSFGGLPIQSSFLTVGQLGSALRRSSHSQGDAPASASAHAGAGPEGQTGDSSASQASEAETSLLQAAMSAQEVPHSNSDSVHSSHSSLPSLLTDDSEHSFFQSANASMRMSQAPQGEGSACPPLGGPLEGLSQVQTPAIGSIYASDMGRYGPSPSNLSSQYMGVFQQHGAPSYEHDEQPEEDWALLESDSSMSGSH